MTDEGKTVNILQIAQSIPPYERRCLVVGLLAELELELFGDGAAATKVAHQVLTGSLSQESWDWLKDRASEGRLA